MGGAACNGQLQQQVVVYIWQRWPPAKIDRPLNSCRANLVEEILAVAPRIAQIESFPVNDYCVYRHQRVRDSPRLSSAVVSGGQDTPKTLDFFDPALYIYCTYCTRLSVEMVVCNE